MHDGNATPDITAVPPGRSGGRAPVIVLSVHQGFSVRYLLQTNILTTLKKSGSRIIVLSQTDPDHLRAAFGGPNIEFEQIPASIGEAASRRGRLQRWLRFVRAYVHGRPVRTTDHTLAIALKDAALANPGPFTQLNLRLMQVVIRAARRWKWLRRMILWLESRLYVPAPYVEFMSARRPDLVVATSLGTFDFDQYVLRAARRRGITTAAVIMSWDNTTTRGYPGAIADHTIAWTDVMKWELAALNDVAEDTISVRGIAHFDRYFGGDESFDRREFLSRLGCDPDKRTILVATKSPNCYAQNPNIAQILAEAIEQGTLPRDCQILLRVHPLHYRFRNGSFVYGNVLDIYRELAERYGCLHLNEPNIQSEKVNYGMAPDEIIFLSRLLRSTDVLVNLFSTMNIEAAMFDVPLVNACFDDVEPLYPCKRGYRFDIMIDYESDHNQRIVRSGGTRIAWTPDELVSHVRDYLAHPELDRDGRAAIVAQEVGPNHGRAGSAVADDILAFARSAVNGG